MWASFTPTLRTQLPHPWTQNYLVKVKSGFKILNTAQRFVKRFGDIINPAGHSKIELGKSRFRNWINMKLPI
jgi:hypothetical protein